MRHISRTAPARSARPDAAALVQFLHEQFQVRASGVAQDASWAGNKTRRRADLAAAGRAQPSASKARDDALLVFMTPPVWRLDMWCELLLNNRSCNLSGLERLGYSRFRAFPTRCG